MTRPPAPTDARVPPRRQRGFKRWIVVALVVLGAAALTHVAYWGSHVDPHVYTAKELASGPRWQITEWDGGRGAVQVSRLSELPPGHLWRVIADHARFGEFMPFVRSASMEPRPDGNFTSKMVLDLPHATYEVTLGIEVAEENDVRTLRWRQIEGTLDFNEGAWIVETHGDRTVLRYRLSASISWLPQFAVNYAMSRRIAKPLAAIEARVRDLEARSPDYFVEEK